ncbi:MAG: hypothetical protein ACHQ52_11610 [Candidatus Eisenbacteria bacterium]
MKTTPILLAAAFATALAAVPARASTVRDLDSRLPVENATGVRAELPVGEFDVARSRDADVHLRLHVKCKDWNDRCEEQIRDLVIRARRDGSVLRFSLENMPWIQHDSFKIHGTLEVPPGLAVQVKLGVGEITIRDVHDDLDVELGVGEVHVAMHEKDVKSVRLSSGVGDASLDVGARHMRSSGLLGHRLHWSEGRGQADVDVEVGVGESSVELD